MAIEQAPYWPDLVDGGIISTRHEPIDLHSALVELLAYFDLTLMVTHREWNDQARKDIRAARGFGFDTTATMIANRAHQWNADLITFLNKKAPNQIYFGKDKEGDYYGFYRKPSKHPITLPDIVAQLFCDTCYVAPDASHLVIITNTTLVVHTTCNTVVSYGNDDNEPQAKPFREVYPKGNDHAYPWLGDPNG